MKKEVTIHYNALATISQAQFENFKPSYSLTEKYILEGDETIDKKEIVSNMKDFVNEQIAEDYNRCKAEYIRKQYENIRFYPRLGKQYPSVTSILDIDADFKIGEDELRQYGSRGTIVHALVSHYFSTKKWVEPRVIPGLLEDVLIVEKGSLGLHWNDCGYKEFLEKYPITPLEWEKVVYNDEHQFAGRLDLIGTFEGKKSIIDFKSGTSIDAKRCFKQISAYASCEPGIEQMVIAHLNSSNKCGYAKPVTSIAIQTFFKQFIKDRIIPLIYWKQRTGVVFVSKYKENGHKRSNNILYNFEHSEFCICQKPS